MLADSAVIVEVCLSIPVTVTPLSFAVRDRPGHILFTEDFLTVNKSRNISKAGTIAVLTILLCCIIRVVRSLCLEVQSLYKESEVQFVLDIEVKDVSTLILITEVIIVRKRITVKRTYDVRIRNNISSLFVNTATCIWPLPMVLRSCIRPPKVRDSWLYFVISISRLAR